MNKDDAIDSLSCFLNMGCTSLWGKNHYLEFFLEIISSSAYLLSAYYVLDIMLPIGLFWSRIFD